MAEYIDATTPINLSLPVWPGDPSPGVHLKMDMEKGDVCNLTEISFTVHTGTHMDAPRHFLSDGCTVEELPLWVFDGPCFVADLGNVEGEILPKHLEGIPNCQRLVLRTSNTARRLLHQSDFQKDFCSIGLEAALEIVRRAIRLVGIDYLSIERSNPPIPEVHQAILGAGIVAVEGLELSRFTPGWWKLSCFPLNLPGVEGSPVRAVFSSLGG